MRKTAVVIAFSLAALPALSGTVGSQDPVPLYPDNYKVIFENDQVRVLDFRLAKGASEMTHSHPAHVAVFLADFKIRFTLTDGRVVIRDARAGDASYSDPTAHASENIGGTDAHGILVKLKAPPSGGSR